MSSLLLMSMQLTRLIAALELGHFEKDGSDFYRELAHKVSARLDEQPEGLKLCLDRIRHLVLSDRVGFYFNVAAELQNGAVVLTGETERIEFKNITREVFPHLGYTSVVDRIEVIPDLQRDADPFGLVTKAHLLTWSDLDRRGIPMDEALLGEPVYLLKEWDEVFLIKTMTGYWGYAAKTGIRRVSRPEFIRWLNEPKATLRRDYKTGQRLLPSGCRLIVAEWGAARSCRLLMPDGEEIQVPKRLCRRHDRTQAMQQITAYARTFLKTPYQLGGKNAETGIDCSGLIQLSYRTIGVNLPRDAKQQYLGGHLILPCVAEALQPGDAIFFMNDSGQVDHTALYLGDEEIIHATGPEVKIQSMNPQSPNYFPRFTQDFIGAKRFWW